MKKILPFDTVRQLIESAGYGTYALYSLSGGENLVAGSHIISVLNDDQKMPTDKLIIHLINQLEMLGDGVYSIVLRSSNQNKNGSAVKFIFQYGDAAAQTQQTPTVNLQGIQPDRIEDIVTARVNALMAEKEAQYSKQREIDILKLQLEALTKRKPPRKKQSDLSGLMSLALVGGSAFIAKQWPETKDMVEKALDAVSGFSGGDDEEDDEEETGFSRPN